MQVLVLLAFVVTLTAFQASAGPPVLTGWGWSLAAVGAYLVLASVLNGVNSVLSLRALRGAAELPRPAARRHALLTLLAHAWLVGGLAGVVMLGYGWWLKEDLGLGRLPLVGEIAAVAPFAVALLVTWVLEYPFHRASRSRMAAGEAPAGRPFWTLSEYLGYNTRHHLLFIAVPVSLIILATDLTRQHLGPVLPDGPIGSALLLGAMLGSTALVFFFTPMLVVRIWKTRPLPAGALRSDLEDLCRRMDLRYRKILIWQSGGVIANAGVMGLAAPVRYILLSDALLENLDRRQVMAIFAHEAGHVVSHHILYSTIFAMASAILCISLGSVLADAAGWPKNAELLALPLLAMVWAVGFGWVSRRFEWQSDAISAWALGDEPPSPAGTVTPEGAAVFAQALECVGRLNGIPYRQHNWRHGSIERRVGEVLWLGSTGGTRRGIDRVVRRIKLGLWVAVLAAVAVTAVELAYGG